MSQMLNLESLVTILACLTTTHDELPPIKQNSLEPFKIDNTTLGGCPVSAVTGLTLRIQHLSENLVAIKREMNDLKEKIADLSRTNRLRMPPTAPVTLLPVTNTPRNCLAQKHGPTRIQPTANIDPFFVFCDEKIRDGGWILIANRYDGSEDFNRGWQDYKIGFGSVNKEFFIGMEKLHLITNSDHYELLIIMQNKDKEERFAIYDQFSIGAENEKYLLYVLGSYAGDAGDSLRYHAGKKFTTYDQDNDENAQNCARVHAGAWWYGRDCFHSNLFGTYQGMFANEIGNYKGILWKNFLNGPNGSLSRVRMLLRPKKTN